MRFHFVTTLLFTLSTQVAHAGGSSYPTTIVSMAEVKPDHYRLVVKTIALSEKQAQFVLHLKYLPSALGSRPPSMVNRTAYDKCIAILKEHFRKNETFSLGVMGQGIVEVPGKPGEHQSNALALLEEYRGGRVCYSFAMPI
jgi:hypothetical protein